jgi:hypothetical protein
MLQPPSGMMNIYWMLGAVAYLGLFVGGFQKRWAGFEPGSGHVRYVVEKMPMGQVFCEYLVSPWQSSHQLLHTHHHPSSGAGTIVQIVADVRSGPTHAPPRETKRKLLNVFCHFEIYYTGNGFLLPGLRSRSYKGKRFNSFSWRRQGVLKKDSLLCSLLSESR